MTVEGKTTTEQLANLRKIVDGLTDDELAKLKGQLGQVGTSFDKVEDEVEDLKDGFQQTKQVVKETDEAFAQQQAFESKIKQFLGLSGATRVLRSALRDAMQTITELDATMTEMAVVTDLTVGDYWDQLPEYSKQASDLGVSINSAYKAATLYYQQGLKGNEVTKISAETLKMAKIAGLDAADATDKMTAALRGFNMELNEASAQRIADVYSELAAITAADVDEISNAMTKTASIASSAGMEFETTAAFLSQIIETTRESAETAGTALKTVIARFQELKKDPAEIGEVDGEIVDANKIETALRSVGVALRDSSGQFRELDDVFLELSSKWDGLDKNTQRYIATIAAGSRQQSRFIAMMSDYGRTQELVASANNSAGASQKQFEKTTESLGYKIERLKNAWHEFTMGIMNSALLKTGIDILSKFLEIVNKATSALDGVGGSLTKIISVVAVFKLASKVFGMIKQPLISFFANVVKMSREEGEKAGKAFDEGARAGATQKEEAKEENPEDKKPKSVKSWIGDKTGVTDIKEGFGNKKRVRDNINSKRALQ
jgi:TP901 family phage tail tape measure protein